MYDYTAYTVFYRSNRRSVGEKRHHYLYQFELILLKTSFYSFLLRQSNKSLDSLLHFTPTQIVFLPYFISLRIPESFTTSLFCIASDDFLTFDLSHLIQPQQWFLDHIFVFLPWLIFLAVSEGYYSNCISFLLSI